MSKLITVVTRSATKAAVVLTLLLSGSCTDMGPTPETSGQSSGISLPLPAAKPPPTVGASRSAPTTTAGRKSSPVETGASDFHRVRAGETVYGIARQYGVDAYALVSLNRLTPPFDLFEGQRLAIPGRGAPPSAVATAEPPPEPTRSRPVARPDSEAAAGQSGARTAAVPRSAEPSATPSAAGAFVWPVEGRIVSDFGTKGGGRFNDGINIAAPAGTAVRAADDGVVAYAGNELRGFGNMLLVKHPGGWVTAYAHNQELLVRRGESVGRGQVIARVGSTGGVDQPQLHFELRKGKKAVDPMDYLRRPSASAAAGRDSG
jgi:murein DD-endopeptidase MepM/ murein hydrolase activator NlpD